MSIGTLHPDCGGRSAKVRGRDASTGLPQTYAVTGEDLRGALEATCLGILGAVKEVLEISAPELVADIADGGIWLTGGGALLHGLPQWMAEQTGVSTQLAEDCLSTVAFGALRALEAKVHGDHLELFRRVI